MATRWKLPCKALRVPYYRGQIRKAFLRLVPDNSGDNCYLLGRLVTKSYPVRPCSCYLLRSKCCKSNKIMFLRMLWVTADMGTHVLSALTRTREKLTGYFARACALKSIIWLMERVRKDLLYYRGVCVSHNNVVYDLQWAIQVNPIC